MKLKNPTNSDVTINYEGNEYTIEANSISQELSPEVVKYWKGKIHAFLEVVEDESDNQVTKATKGKKAKDEKEEKEVVEVKGVEGVDSL